MLLQQDLFPFLVSESQLNFTAAKVKLKTKILSSSGP